MSLFAAAISELQLSLCEAFENFTVRVLFHVNTKRGVALLTVLVHSFLMRFVI